MQDIFERFWKKVSVPVPFDTAPCWEWIAAKTPQGYGQFVVNSKKVLAHRFLYEQEIKPIPSHLFLCHRCDNPACVNPHHCFIGTARDNSQDMSQKGRINPVSLKNLALGPAKNRARQACKHGHAFSEENTAYAANGSRYCRQCSRLSTARFRAKNKEVTI